MSILALALKLAPAVIGLFSGRKKELIAQKVVDVAKTLTGQSDEQKAIEQIQASPELARELAAQANALALAEVEADTENARVVNETMRAELSSTGFFKSGWRPAYGWCMTFCFTVWVLGTMFMTAYFITSGPKDFATAIDSMSQWISAWLVVWGVAFAVLGVNISNRSKDKQTAAGVGAPGILASIFGR